MDGIVTVDGISYAVRFQGFDVPLEIVAPGGTSACFQPWSYRQHLQALRECVRPDGERIQLDGRAFARQVLSRSQIPEALHDTLAPLALWWACGGAAAQPSDSDGEWHTLGLTRVRLRPWSQGERLLALSHSMIQEADGAVLLDLAAYLDAMVRASAIAVDPPVSLDELDAASTRALLNAVVTLNTVAAGAAVESLLESPQVAQTTLRLCRALGWTPSQVWATPAAEIDCLLALLDRVEGVSPVLPRSQGLAGHPDAVVIRIEDD